MTYLILIIIIIATIKYLPFINLDASLRLQFWLKKVERYLEDATDVLERKNKEKEEKKNKKK